MIKLYGDTVEINFMPKSHRYKANGVFVPGVSSIIGILHKDLGEWMVWMAVNSFNDAVERFVLSDQKMTKIALKTVVDNAKKAHKVKSQHGMDVGTFVHDYVAQCTDLYLQEGYWDNVTPVWPENADDTFKQQAENAVNQWWKWVKDYQIKPIKRETVVYSKKLNYCGTFDILFKSSRTGKTYMGDYKTSDPMKIRNSKYVITGYKAYPEHFIQCAAYDFAHNEETGEEVDGYAVIYLPKEGDVQMFTREEVTKDRQGWALLVQTYGWVSEMKRAK